MYQHLLYHYKGGVSLNSTMLTASNIFQAKPRWWNIMCLQRAALTVLKCIETHKHAYPQGVHGYDRCAAALRWAFQHFWSGQQPAHSFPLSQYLHKHIFKGKIFLLDQITTQHEHVWSSTDHFFLKLMFIKFLFFFKS